MKKGEIVFTAATNNAGKLKEINDILNSVGYACRSLAQAGVSVDPDETGETFTENAWLKAEAVHALVGGAVLADDSGLVVDALGGAPGVHTARYAGENADNEQNIEKLIAALGELPKEQRTARFVSVAAAILPDGTRLKANGVCEGYIGFSRAGEGGFGYDPVFYFFNNHSMAQLPDARKNQVSHRARAVRKLCFKLRNITRMKKGD